MNIAHGKQLQIAWCDILQSCQDLALQKSLFLQGLALVVSVAVILLTEYPELLLIKPWSFQASENEKQVITKKSNLKALNQLYQGTLQHRQSLRCKFQAIQHSEDHRQHFSSHNSSSSILLPVSRINMTRQWPATASLLMRATYFIHCFESSAPLLSTCQHEQVVPCLAQNLKKCISLHHWVSQLLLAEEGQRILGSLPGSARGCFFTACSHLLASHVHVLPYLGLLFLTCLHSLLGLGCSSRLFWFFFFFLSS